MGSAIAVWHADALWLATGPQERKARNLAENPSCVLMTGRSDLVDGALDVVIEGQAKQVTDETDLALPSLESVLAATDRLLKVPARWHAADRRERTWVARRPQQTNRVFTPSCLRPGLDAL
jgi:Pyridoxamine 5'-phosphate oxidase